MSKQINIGLLGCGTVGAGFVGLLKQERARIRARFDIDLCIRRILVRDTAKVRSHIDLHLLTRSAIDVLDSGFDIVVELVGGIHAAGAFVRRAIGNGCHVVTANKALLASFGPELFAAARLRGVSIGFEASVCGATPVVRAIRAGLAGDRVESIEGILNGTCNFILTRMEEDGLDFATALRRAQDKGFAEADPGLDVDGHDAAQKLQILAGIAFEDPVVRVSRAGIRGLTQAAVNQASGRNSVWRQVARARRIGGGVELTIQLEELPKNSFLGRTRDEDNAVVVRGRAVGEITFGGKGAGSLPTAAAILSDVIEITAPHQGMGGLSPRKSADNSGLPAVVGQAQGLPWQFHGTELT